MPSRRDFLLKASAGFAASAAVASKAESSGEKTSGEYDHPPSLENDVPSREDDGPARHQFNGWYEGDYLSRIAFPLGGMGAGWICLEGSGMLSRFSLWNQPKPSELSNYLCGLVRQDSPHRRAGAGRTTSGLEVIP